MDDPVKGESRMITDANGITRREGRISGIWDNIFNESNGIKADSPPLIPDIRDILDVFPQSLRENLVNKISEAIDYVNQVCVMRYSRVKCVRSETLKPVRVRPRNCAYASANVR